ncbi:hypothetical protein CsSME_00027995 [Camellia sinensis var. sinensis]
MLPTPTGGRPPVRCRSGIGPKKKFQWGSATSLGARPPLGSLIISFRSIYKNSNKKSY